MNEVITIYHLYEVDGGGMGAHVGTYGYFPTKEAAEKASQWLGHGYFGIEPTSALKLESGEVYLLQKDKPISFGMKRRS